MEFINHKIRWYHHIILLFVRTKISVDVGPDRTTVIAYKVFRGRFYVLSCNQKMREE